PADIIATVSDANLDSWTLERAPFGTNDFTPIASGTSPVAGPVLTRFDPALLSAGFYRLRLTATDIAGRTSTAEATIEAAAPGTRGDYQRSETDLTVDFGGKPYTLVRRYDSFSKDHSGAFGYGWQLADRDLGLQTDVPLTGREPLGLYNPFRFGTRIYLTLPTGQRVGFTFTPQRHDLTGVTYYTPAFTADPGVTWTLSASDAKLTA